MIPLFIVIIPYLVFFLIVFVSDTIGDEASPFIPYSVIQNLNFQHHISYNGHDYYLIGGGVPDEYSLFGDKVEVTLVDKSGKPYNEDRVEEGWLYRNDTEEWFLFYNSDPYTRDKRLVMPEILE